MHDVETLREDLAIARALAMEPEVSPLSGGVHYVIFGLTMFGCLIFQWSVVAGVVAISPWAIAIVWFGGMAAAAALTGIAARRSTEAPGAFAVGNAVSNAAWRASGRFLGLFALALFAAAFAAPDWMFGAGAGDGAGRLIAAAFSIFLPVSFGVYSVAMAASAAAAKSEMLGRFSFLALLVMAVTIALIGRPAQMLVAAAGILLVSVLPGLLLIREARNQRNDER